MFVFVAARYAGAFARSAHFYFVVGGRCGTFLRFGLDHAHLGQPGKEPGKGRTRLGETSSAPTHRESVCADDTEFSEFVEGLGDDFFEPLLVFLPEERPSL